MQSGQAINLNLNTVTTGATVYVANQGQVSVQISSVAISTMPAVTGSMYMTNPYIMTTGTVAVQSMLGSANLPVYWTSPQDVFFTNTVMDVSGSTVAVNVSTHTFVDNQISVSSHVIMDNFVPIAASSHVIVDNQLTASTHTAIDNFPASQAVTGTFFQGTQPVSFLAPTVYLATTSVSISGSSNTVQVSNFPASQAVTGTFFQATQPVSIAGTVATTLSGFPSVLVYAPLSLSVSTVSISGAAVTASCPAVVSSYHYIQYLEIEAYSSAARTGVAAPITCTSSNLMNNPSWTFATAAAIGTTDVHTYNTGFAPVKATSPGVGTTVTCPATTGVVWRINIFYYTGG